MSFALVREATNRLTGKNRDTMETIIGNYERKDKPEEMLDPMLALSVILLDELGEEE
tara:strand:+ start:172 stop:342 length:171 start_codon:yes stop_codon:yes gene_type:complete